MQGKYYVVNLSTPTTPHYVVIAQNRNPNGLSDYVGICSFKSEKQASIYCNKLVTGKTKLTHRQLTLVEGFDKI